MSKLTLEKFLAEEKRVQGLYEEISKLDFMAFCRGLYIEAGSKGKLFGCNSDGCMADFQRKCFQDLSGSLHSLRKGEMPEGKRWWIERTKKAGKDSDLAIVILWLIAFPERPIYLQVGAANRQQASVVKDRITHLLHYNSWLNDYVELIQWTIRSKKTMANGKDPMASMEIMSSDIAGAHGGTPDLLIINELSHVDKWEFVENLMSNATGVAKGMVIIATNAGFKGTKAEVWRKNAIKSDLWKCHFWSEPAPWHDEQTILDEKGRDPASRFNRLWYGKWVSGKGDAISEDVIEKCFCLDGPTKPEKGWEYIGALDIGVAHDHSGFVILGVNREKQKIKTAYWESWAPNSVTKKVDLVAVEKACLRVGSKYNIRVLLYDPTEATLMAQRLSTRLNMVEMRFIPANLTLMADTFIQVMNSGKLDCYDDEKGTLRRDFGKFDIVEMKYGFRLDACRDEFGHADVGTALVIALPKAVEMLQGWAGELRPDDDLVADDSEMTSDEFDTMPDEFKGLWDLDEENKIFEEEYFV